MLMASGTRGLGPSFVWIALAITVGLSCLVAFSRWYFSRAQRAKRALGAERPHPIAALPLGALGKAVGTVELIDDDCVEAPCSKRLCAAYEVLVEEHPAGGRGDWSTVLRECRGVDFLLTDASGVARIRARALKLVSVADVELHSGGWNDASPELEAFLASRGTSSQGFVFNKRMRYREGIIEAGEDVAVLGVVRSETRPEPAQAGGYRGAQVKRGARRVIEAPPGGELLVSDDPTTLG